MPWGDCVNAAGVATLQCIPAVFKNIVSAMFTFVGVVTLAIIIMQGYKIITSAGDAKQLDAAKKSLVFALIGLIIVLLAFFFLNTIGVITGAKCISTFGFESCK